ncbi:lysophospholipase [Delitschia confertaspora ATCC 74209]|uniref:Lysophospholipase n=1 Tax=Delitschia confertaspora ATCC 74209 TaxID=1513339 RepID=A0A9P4MP94_9PLEO|nr:lysophospholipase [Delitschia confertaspora ATCC 74209]
MKGLHELSSISLFASLATASVLPRDPALNDVTVWERATPQAPNAYAPAAVNCPSTRPSIRPAHDISDQEKSWLEKRRSNTMDPMREFLIRMNITGFDAGKYIDNHRNNVSALPNIGIAASGGGYRAMLNGAGAVAAFDSRTPNSTNTGQLGGLLQSSTYLAGLSGGGWLVGSIMVNNYTSVQNLMNANPDNSGSTWQLSNSILEGPATEGIQLVSTVDYYDGLVKSVESKANAGLGFDTSLTDYWGRALSFQLVNATEGGPAYTWSSIADDADFSAGKAPMPILVADERAPGDQVISLNSTVLEFNPWEMGSFDPTLYGFAPLKYLGSNFTGGKLPDEEKCITGFDNAGFIMGTSSSLFNAIILSIDQYPKVPQFLKDALKGVLQSLGKAENDIADYSPNPFYHYNNRSNPSAQSRQLTLVDGGEDLQNIPLHPLIQPFRQVDVIFAIDSSADTAPNDGNWPNGASLGATYARSSNSSIQNGTAFPSVPDNITFVNLGLNNRPAFFGCDAANLTGPAPLIVYLPNSPYVYFSNISTFQYSYNNTERNAVINNGYNVVTMGNGTRDAEWSTCVGCAVLSRSLDRTGTKVPDVCKKCFDRYCWDGTVNTTTPALYNPSLILKDHEIKVKSGAGHYIPNFFGLIFSTAVATFFLS